MSPRAHFGRAIGPAAATDRQSRLGSCTLVQQAQTTNRDVTREARRLTLGDVTINSNSTNDAQTSTNPTPPRVSATRTEKASVVRSAGCAIHGCRMDVDVRRTDSRTERRYKESDGNPRRPVLASKAKAKATCPVVRMRRTDSRAASHTRLTWEGRVSCLPSSRALCFVHVVQAVPVRVRLTR